MYVLVCTDRSLDPTQGHKTFFFVRLVSVGTQTHPKFKLVFGMLVFGMPRMHDQEDNNLVAYTRSDRKRSQVL